MTQNRLSLVERRSAVAAGRRALAEWGGLLHEASGAEVAELVTLADEVAALARSVQVEAAVEVVRRGEVAGREVDAWVKGHAPSLRQGGWYPLAKVAQEVAAASRGSGLGAATRSVMLDGAGPLGMVWSAMTSAGAGARDDSRAAEDRCLDIGGGDGRGDQDDGGGTGDGGDDVGDGRSSAAGVLLGAGSALAVLAEIGKLRERLVPEAVPTVTAALVDLAVSQGTGVMRRLRPALIARHGLPGELDRLQERLVSSAFLSTSRVRSMEVTEYALVMTPAQAAVLEAAIGPRSVPAPNEQTGEPDLRPAGQRRVEALTEVISRGAALDVDASAGGDGAAGSAVALHVTVPLADLYDTITGRRTTEVGAGEVLGSLATGTLIGPAQLRRIACDAVLIPYVLGSAGEIIDQGRAVRLFTRAQRRRLTMRDQGCTYPGCRAPASWCIAHHVRWWEHHGPSDLDNGALLCRRHHTVVHQRRQWAAVRERPDEQGRYVIWDSSPGSYDSALEHLRTREPDAQTRRAHADALLGQRLDNGAPGSSRIGDSRGHH
ncbi:MAG: HNH endonuclease signature motif containing protein, partial [Phycicoccus sp.]